MCFWWRRGRVELYLKHDLSVLGGLALFVKPSPHKLPSLHLYLTGSIHLPEGGLLATNEVIVSLVINIPSAN
jgi:hypothetical protein